MGLFGNDKIDGMFEKAKEASDSRESGSDKGCIEAF